MQQRHHASEASRASVELIFQQTATEAESLYRMPETEAEGEAPKQAYNNAMNQILTVVKVHFQ
jgi:hypothetical protein